MILAPRTRLGRYARLAQSVLSLAIAVGVFLALGFAFGAAVAVLGFVLCGLMIVFAYRRGVKLRGRMKVDPAGTMARLDREAVVLGKFYAGVAFAVVGVGLVAIIAVFVTHA